MESSGLGLPRAKDMQMEKARKALKASSDWSQKGVWGKGDQVVNLTTISAGCVAKQAIGPRNAG